MSEVLVESFRPFTREHCKYQLVYIMINPFNTIGNFGSHLNFTQLLGKQVA